jgi:hypothetical protein
MNGFRYSKGLFQGLAQSVTGRTGGGRNTAKLKAAVSNQLMELRSIYGGEEGSLIHALQEWMQTFYRRPRPDLLLGVWAAAAQTPGAFTGPGAFPAAVFLSRSVVQQFEHSSDRLYSWIDALSFASSLGAGLDNPPQTSLHSAALMETLFRALYLADKPLFDATLGEIVPTWVREHQEEHEVGADDEVSELAAAAASLFPPPPARVRVPLLDWPIPSMSLSTFEAHVTQSRFPIYAASRYLFSGTHACYQLANKDRGRLAVLLPHVASCVTNSLVDGYWSEFYARGTPHAVLRVIDVATPYMDFVDEYGVEWATKYKQAEAAVSLSSGWNDLGGIPEEFGSDPYARMRFETSRYALWSLLVNAATHTVVGDVFIRHAAAMDERVAMLGPLSDVEIAHVGMTAFGRTQLRLMKILSPSIADLYQHADKIGIGSGIWPESYPAPGIAFDSTALRRGDFLLESNSPLHSAAAITSECVSAASVSSDSDASGDRVVGVQRRA